MANSTTPPPPPSLCPPPFIAQPPFTGGARPGQFCGPVGTGTCCLPCPLEQWLYSDTFERNLEIAYWFNVPALVCQGWLLLGFLVLQERHSRVHYLSCGLCISLVLLELSFIVPLGAKPNQCHDAATPNDLHSDMLCGWSGALMEAGAMAGAVWILLRSLWTHLRVCFDIHHTPFLFYLSQLLGWGLPALFLSISLPITGVSYQLGTTCFPNRHNAFITWFGWLLAFACTAALIQIVTTGFCLWLYVRHFWQSSSAGSSGAASGEDGNVAALMPDAEERPRRASIRLGKRLAWRRVKKVLLLQWRSILLSILVIIDTVYFAVVFVANTKAVEADMKPDKTAAIEQWAACLVLSGGKKNECLQYAGALGLDETLGLATFFMSAVIGLFTFALMVRGSMFVGWWELIRSPMGYRRGSRAELFVLVSPTTTMTKKWGEARGTSLLDLTGILPDVDGRGMGGVPEPGDVSTRHETTDLFEDDDEDEDVERVVGGREKRVRLDVEDDEGV